jgi:hypothetical protein
VGKKAQAQVLINVLRGHKSHHKYTKAELDVIDILKRMKNNNKLIASENTEPSREQSQACVETGHGISKQSEMFG